MANKIILAVAVTAFLALTPQLSTAARHDAGRGNAVTEVCQTGSTAAKPFKGVWKAGVDFNEAVIELDFYGKSVNGWDDDGNDVKCYGTIHVGMGTNAYNYKVDDCVITAWKADGNKAEITFTGGRDGNVYTATLTVNPAKRTLTVGNVTRVGDSEFGECYVTDGLVLKKK